jgi:hypothetical protein
MVYKVVINFPDCKPPARAYVSLDGFSERFGNERNLAYKKATDLVLSDLDIQRHIYSAFGFLITFVNPEEMIYFGFTRHNGEWPGQVKIKSWIVEDGIYMPRGPEFTENDLIVVKNELDRRRKSDSLKSFTEMLPIIEGLPILDRINYRDIPV